MMSRNVLTTFSGTNFHGEAPSLSWKFGSDLRMFRDSSEIIFLIMIVFRCIPLFSIFFHRQKCQVGPKLSLLQKSPTWSDGREQCFMLNRWKLRTKQSPDAPPGIFWLIQSNNCAFFHRDDLNPFSSWFKLCCVTCKLRTHAISTISDSVGTRISMYNRP